MKWLKKLFTKKAIKKVTGSVVRTALAFAAGWLASQGLPPETVDQLSDPAVQEFLTGVGTVLIVQLWSWVEKATK